MATIDKTSVRTEIDRLKTEFEQLCSDGKVSPDTRVVVNSMLVIIELILSIFLEKKTRKNTKNLSLPSSQTEKDETFRPQSKGKHVSGEVSNTRVKETVSISKVEACDSCGAPLDETPCNEYERRTKIDIIFEKVVEHVDAEIKYCPNCKATVKGCFPQDMPGNLQYGNGLKAFAIHLIIGQVVALNRVQKQISAMVGVVISEASLLKFIWRLNQALEPWEANAIEKILQAPTIHVDETSFELKRRIIGFMSILQGVQP